jgi:Prokaryotic RING finger family 1/Domain of unknown function (DUF4190)
MDASRNLKVNLKLEGKPCLACKTTLRLGEDAAICTGCEADHHRRCWDAYGGCATPGCANAPLKRLDNPYAAAPNAGPPPLPPDMMRCPACRQVIPSVSQLCGYCRAITSPDGVYHGIKTNAPGAVQSFVLGIIGLFVCQFILGPLAIARAREARNAILFNPTYGGSGFATAGLVLGIVDLVVFAIFLFLKAGGG